MGTTVPFLFGETMKIDYELIKTFPAMGLYQSKAAIADYAESEFGLKIQRNLSFENMVKKLEDHVGADKAPAKPINRPDAAMIEEVQTPAPEIVEIKTVVVPDPELVEIQVKIPETTYEEIAEMAKVVAKTNDRKSDLLNLLPPDFKPCFVPMGEIEGFYPLSYWINDWIQSTPDWCYKVHEYPRVQEHKFLYTLIYFIAKFGKFMIRETRNGQYVTLS